MQLAEPTWLRRLPAKFVIGVATLGPLGQRLPAPGTWGSLAGLLYTLLLFRRLSWAETLVYTLIASYLAVAFTGEAAKRMGRKDPGEVILDEFVVMPLVFIGWHSGFTAHLPEWGVALAGFGLFRFYDIVKPLGIHRLQSWPGGWGIVVDDFVAALAACATLHLGAWIWSMR